jgi:hypothetical protein
VALNPVSELSASLDSVVSLEQKGEIEPLTDKMWRDSWAYHCDHQIKHLDAIALANVGNRTVLDRVALLKSVVETMKSEGMPEIALIAEL